MARARSVILTPAEKRHAEIEVKEEYKAAVALDKAAHKALNDATKAHTKSLADLERAHKQRVAELTKAFNVDAKALRTAVKEAGAALAKAKIPYDQFFPAPINTGGLVADPALTAGVPVEIPQ
jgi:hypothetical protein